jgi:hypothetical protein
VDECHSNIVLEQNMSNLKENHEEQAKIELKKMKKERNQLREEKKKHEEKRKK